MQANRLSAGLKVLKDPSGEVEKKEAYEWIVAKRA